jgi:protein NRD1
MASAVTDLEAGLQAMLNLKPPGVSGSRITSLTSLCVSNIQACPLLLPRLLALTIVPHHICRPSANLASPI